MNHAMNAACATARGVIATAVGLVALVGGLAGCGGGGGGGAPPVGSPDVELGGTLRLPSFGASASSGGAFGDGGVFDGDAFHARRALLALRADGRVAFGGRVGPASTDALDVLRVTLDPGTFRIALQAASGQVEARVFETRGAAEVGAVRAERALWLRVVEPSAVDVVLRSGDPRAAQAWQIEIVGVPDGVPDGAGDLPTLPGLDAFDRPRSELQGLYLGAHHEMAAGRIVALRAAPAAGAVAVAPVAPLAGLELARAATDGELLVYRVTERMAPARAVDASALAASVELETCLVAAQLARQPGFRAAAPDYIRRIDAPATKASLASAAPLPRQPSDTYWDLQWHFRVMDMEQAWDRTTGSADVVVGIIDSGIVSRHPEFTGRIVDGFDFVSDLGLSLDGDGIDADPEDPGDQARGAQGSSWHGTHVAGTIAANGDDGLGVAGMDWNCRLVPLRALGQGGRGQSSDILEAVRFAAGLGNVAGRGPNVSRGRVDVLNMSLGGPGGSAVEQQVYADVAAAGVTVVVAAGNDGSPTPNYPASYPDTISVGSLGFDLVRAPYSNFANTVTVWAPGGDMSVDRNGDGYADGVLSAVGPLDSQVRWDFSQGTSMACPHVAGLAALILAQAPGRTPAQVRALLASTARLVDGGQRAMVQPVAALDAVGGGGGGAAPDLVVDPLGVDLGVTETQARLSLRNAGGGRIELSSRVRVRFDPPQATGWLGLGLEPPGDGTISHSALLVQVDRAGLAPGRYTASVELSDVSATVTETVSIALAVADPAAGGGGGVEPIYVLLVDPVLSDPQAPPVTVAQAVTDQGRQLRWALGFPAGRRPAAGFYWIVAGTDRDGDDVIGDEGELFGIWPFRDEPSLLDLPVGAYRRAGLDVDLFQVQALGVAGGGQRFRLLPGRR